MKLKARCRGSAPLEIVAMLPMLMLVVLLMAQVLVAVWTLGRAEWAAWAGARAHARGATPAEVEAAVRAIVGDGLLATPETGTDGCWAEVRIQVGIPVMVWIMDRTGVELPPVPAQARFPREGGACL